MALLVETFAKGEFKTIVLWKFWKGLFFPGDKTGIFQKSTKGATSG